MNTQIHYGATKFCKSKFRKITNRNWNKPRGGLWSSSINSDRGWKWFCTEEGFRGNEYLSKFFKFRVSGKIYKIDSVYDLLNVPAKITYEGRRFIDFERLRDLGYSAIWLTWEGQRDTRWSDNMGMDLYGWDVESTLLLDSSAVEFPKIYINTWRRNKKNVKTTAGIFGSIRSLYRYYQNNIVQSLGDTVISEPILSAEDNKIIGKLEIKWKQ